MIQYKGGDGQSKQQAVIILRAESELEGVDAEYKYLESLYGEQNVEWRLGEQTLIIDGKKYYDVLEIEFRNQKQITFWFDITNFYERGDE